MYPNKMNVESVTCVSLQIHNLDLDWISKSKILNLLSIVKFVFARQCTLVHLKKK